MDKGLNNRTEQSVISQYHKNKLIKKGESPYTPKQQNRAKWYIPVSQNKLIKKGESPYTQRFKNQRDPFEEWKYIFI